MPALPSRCRRVARALLPGAILTKTQTRPRQDRHRARSGSATREALTCPRIDAGSAIDTARNISLDQVTVTERKASLLIDTACAFLQYGKHENAYLALRAARDVAPEEIAGRPAVHRLLRDLISSAPPSVRRQAEEFAYRKTSSRPAGTPSND